MSTTGGHKLKAHVRAARARHGLHMIEVGFKDRLFAPLAQLLEFGNAATGLPERPAFRDGARRLEEVARDHTPTTYAEFVGLAVAMRDTIRQSYHDFHGEPLSERQKTRKEDTPFKEDQLIGSEGPKLIAHIHAYLDGERVG